MTFKNAQPLRNALVVVPADRLLVETDAPYLTPAPYRGRPNASYLVPHTMRAMAEVRGDDLEALCAAVSLGHGRRLRGRLVVQNGLARQLSTIPVRRYRLVIVGRIRSGEAGTHDPGSSTFGVFCFSSSTTSVASAACWPSSWRVVALAVAGTTVAYASMTKSVTLSVDGESQQVTALGGTVGDVLDAEGIEIGDHDHVAPGLDEEVTDGTKISVRFGRQLELNVDGDEQTYWVTATDRRRRPAADRPGLHRRRALGQPRRGHRPRWPGPRGRHPEAVTVKVGAAKAKTKTVAALDVRDLLDEPRGRRSTSDDKVKPALGATIDDGDKVVVTRIKTVTKRVKREVVEHGTVEQSDDEHGRGRRPASSARARTACAT